MSSRRAQPLRTRWRVCEVEPAASAPPPPRLRPASAPPPRCRRPRCRRPRCLRPAPRAPPRPARCPARRRPPPPAAPPAAPAAPRPLPPPLPPPPPPPSPLASTERRRPYLQWCCYGWSSCAEDRIEAELSLGRHTAVVAELEQQVSEHPLADRPRAQLMLAGRIGRVPRWAADPARRAGPGAGRLAEGHAPGRLGPRSGSGLGAARTGVPRHAPPWSQATSRAACS